MEPEIHSKKTAKGIHRAAREKISHEDYLSMFEQMPRDGDLPHMVINKRFTSILHRIYTVEQRKRGLVPFDDKRYLLANLPDADSQIRRRKPTATTRSGLKRS